MIPSSVRGRDESRPYFVTLVLFVVKSLRFGCGFAALGSLWLTQNPSAQPPLRGSDPPTKAPDSG